MSCCDMFQSSGNQIYIVVDFKPKKQLILVIYLKNTSDPVNCVSYLSTLINHSVNFSSCSNQVALKTLIVIHRALREVDPTFQEELINYGRSKGHMLNMAHFKDDSGPNGKTIFFILGLLHYNRKFRL